MHESDAASAGRATRATHAADTSGARHPSHAARGSNAPGPSSSTRAALASAASIARLASTVFVAWLALACAACLAPPALIAADGVDLDARIAEMPAGAERVEIAAADGSLLRGVYVPADDERAPLCVHLLGSSDTAAARRFPQRPLLAALRDLGVASLMLDYRGVGASSGERHVDHLAPDALAMWNEALRRCGGDAQRVVLRATSIGTVAVAELLAAHAHPRGVVLVAPILPDTVVAHYARVEHGWYGPWLADLLFRPVARVDVLRELEHADCALLVCSSDHDRFLGDDERARFRACVERHRDGAWECALGGHYFSALQGRGVSAQEIAFWRSTVGVSVDRDARVAAWLERLPDDARRAVAATPENARRFADFAEHKRDGDPLVCAAAALELPNASLALRLAWALETAPYPREQTRYFGLDDWRATFSLADPAGPLPAEWWVAAMERRAAVRRGNAASVVFQGAVLAQLVALWSRGSPLGYTDHYTAGGETGALELDFAALGEQLFARLEENDVRRQVLRLFLRFLHVPERVRLGANGEIELEVSENGAWRRVDGATSVASAPAPMKP